MRLSLVDLVSTDGEVEVLAADGLERILDESAFGVRHKRGLQTHLASERQSVLRTGSPRNALREKLRNAFGQPVTAVLQSAVGGVGAGVGEDLA